MGFNSAFKGLMYPKYGDSRLIPNVDNYEYLPVHMAERGESIFIKTAVRASSLTDVLLFHARGVILCFDYAVTAVTCNVR
jgi:hypothetical protein